ncbi:hypothetical protein S40288_06697 [Stachybotrys chartarum IBT 40288]|nr:hypothetical protein S40288_06697 [Stachybotrys chartarum IBT 40288]
MTSSTNPYSGVGSGLSEVETFSCLRCRQRKVKCDRRTPCSNCTKAQKECSFLPPVRGKRKRTKPPREGLHAKLRRYEQLLKSYGARLETSEIEDDTTSTPDLSSEVDLASHDKNTNWTRNAHDPYQLDGSNSVLFSKGGTSRYMDSSLWSNLGSEFRQPGIDEPEPLMEAGATGGFDHQANDIIFDSANSRDTLSNGRLLGTEDLAALYLSDPALEQLCRVFANGIDPLAKVVHLPTFLVALQHAHRNPKHVSKDMEALIFSFYLVTISIMDEEECTHVLGGPRDLLHSRYRLASRQALLHAGLLSTTSIVIIQAYVLFMMGARDAHRADTLFIYSGVAIRLARKMGLHRDGSSLGLRPFESEIRRRLWWSLVIIDFRMADSLGIRPSMDLMCSDARAPLNVEDEDLHPDMEVDPPSRHGITRASILLIRCEIFCFLRNLSPFSAGVRLELIGSAEFSTTTKEKHINELEDLLEKKYLRYCDLSDSLHMVVSMMGRSAICRLRLHACTPRRSAGTGVHVPRSDRDIVLTDASKLLGQALMIFNTASLKQYSWQISECHLWTVILFVLIEVRHQKVGPEVDRAWNLIWEATAKSPQIFDESAGVLCRTLRKWMVEVWDSHAAALRAAGSRDPPEPDAVRVMRQCIAASERPRSKQEGRISSRRSPQSWENLGGLQLGGELNHVDENHVSTDSYDFSDILTFEMNTDEWLQWENLIAEERGFA